MEIPNNLGLFSISVSEGRAQGDLFGYWPDRAGIIGFSVKMSNNLSLISVTNGNPFRDWPDGTGVIGLSIEMSNNLVCH